MTSGAGLRVLFLCTANSCRSQMAEGWARHLKAGIIEAYSAGLSPSGVNPIAAQVMAEAGASLEGQYSKHLDSLAHLSFDYVVTLCGSAQESCPRFPGTTKVVHVGFEDPPKLAQDAKSEAERIDCYRKVRDQIKIFIQSLPKGLRSNCHDEEHR